jgi:hypothetical protein
MHKLTGAQPHHIAHHTCSCVKRCESLQGCWRVGGGPSKATSVF